MATPTYPTPTIAKLLLLTERRVQQLASEGIIPRAERGRFELAPAVQGYIRYLQERRGLNESASGDPINDAKTRLIKARARTAELEADQLEGKLLDRAEVERAWSTLVLNMRSRLLAIPSRAAPRVIAAAGLMEASALLEQMVSEALNELSQQPIDAEPDLIEGQSGADPGGTGGDGGIRPTAEAHGI
jgi:phage terminase Nu1 subunit (DNA packaging protein)